MYTAQAEVLWVESLYRSLAVPDTVTQEQITDSGAQLIFLFLGTWWSLVKPAWS